jgi:hypothetical protein
MLCATFVPTSEQFNRSKLPFRNLDPTSDLGIRGQRQVKISVPQFFAVWININPPSRSAPLRNSVTKNVLTRVNTAPRKHDQDRRQVKEISVP